MKVFAKILSLVLLLNILPCTSTKAAAESVPPLPAYFSDVDLQVSELTPFKPVHKYACMQNPPDFSWPMISGAVKYDLIVCADEELTDIKYSKYGINRHYYNFSHTFDVGTYYWAVRYYNSSSSLPSAWSAPRRFRIDPDASEFVVPEDMSEITDKIPKSHPRIWTTQESLDDFKALAKGKSGQKVLKSMTDLCDIYMTQEAIEEPATVDEATKTEGTKSFQCQLGALCYLLTDETRYADYAVKTMLELSAWDYTEDKTSAESAPTSFNGQDQLYYDILLRLSMSYDWMYNYMTEPQRKTVRDTLMNRFLYRRQKDLDTLKKSPYNSHIWSYFGYYGTACMALMHDEDGTEYETDGKKYFIGKNESYYTNNSDKSKTKYYIDSTEGYLKQMLELYLTSLPPMSFEDGGWSKGTAYWTYAFTRDKWFMDILKAGDYIDCYQKAWAQNEVYWAMYMMPPDSYGSFGDESNFTKPGTSYMMGLTKLGKFTESSAAFWTRNKVGSLDNMQSGLFDLIMFADVLDEDGERPLDLPNSRLFIDQGMTAMHSSLTSDERISMYFRAGKYGSYNHMHADQNSFFIEAYGERLAVKSGYYDSYHSFHDSGFTRATYAHNSITYDGGKGQLDDSMDANGNTEMFVTQHDFDSVTGNATRAYNYTKNGEKFGLDKYKRSVIYVRPDIYITVDDLKAAEGEQSSFEWGFNAPYLTMSLDDTKNKASVVNGKAAMELELVYPQNMTHTELMRNFKDLNGNEFKPGTGLANNRYGESNPQDRVYFKTEKTDAEKIVSTMRVHKSDEDAANIEYIYGDGYVLIKSGNATAVINTSEDSAKVSAGEVEFVGTAAVYNGKSIMLVGGTELKYNGSVVFKSDREITAVCGKGQLCISSDDDMTITVGTSTSYTNDLSCGALRDDKGRTLSEKIGIYSIAADGGINLYAQKGNYLLLAEEDSVVNADMYIPRDLTVARKNSGKDVEIEWDEKSGFVYDLTIDGVEYKNVHSPYGFVCDTDKWAEIKIRAEKDGVRSSYSDAAYVYPNGNVSAENLVLVYTDKDGKETDSPKNSGSVYARLDCYNGANGTIRVVLAGYSGQGRLTDIVSANPNTGGYSRIKTDELEIKSGSKYKAFVFGEDGLTPLLTASVNADNPLLAGISVNGVGINDFDPDKTEYKVIAENGIIPLVKGIPSDGSVSVSVRYDAAENKAEITTKSLSEESAVYTINFDVGDSEAVFPVSELEHITAGMTYQEYCAYAGLEADENYTSSKKISSGIYKLMSFSVGGNLLGENAQRKITSVDRALGIEDCLFIGSGASLYQKVSSAPWIVSAFTGLKTEADGCVLDLGSKSVPWFSFKVNYDCNVIVLSGTKPKFCEDDSKWIYTSLNFEPYTAERFAANEYSNVTVFKNMYTRSCKAGETVTMYNDASGTNGEIPYLTIVKFK